MAVLNDKDIKKEMELGNVVITGHELYIGPSSVDLHLDNKAMILDGEKIKGVIEFGNENSMNVFTEYKDWDEIVIHPGEFYILSTIENIKFPDDVVGFVQGRSSIARLGINIHAAGFVDAGFEGNITLEVTNFTQYPISIPKGTRIGQMVFVRAESKAEVPYWKKLDAKYKNQQGPTVTKIHQDYAH